MTNDFDPELWRRNFEDDQVLLLQKDRDQMEGPAIHPRRRPGIVTFVAVIQISRGLILGVAFALLQGFPGTNWGSLAFWGTVYVASNGAGHPGFLTPIASAYAVIVGWGLLSLRAWARRLAMLTSGITSALWIRYLVLNWVISGSDLSTHVHTLDSNFARESVGMLILVDAFVFCCLTLYPDVTEAFADR